MIGKGIHRKIYGLIQWWC